MIGRRVKPAAAGADKPKGFDDFELRLGDVMRGERATLSKSLLDVQRELRIKAGHIAAIENCDVSAFETPSFIAGYVRSYARYLGLDPEWAFQRFCTEANFQVAHGMSPAASGVKMPAAPRFEYSDPLANPNATFVPRGPAFLSRIEPAAVGSIFVLVALICGIGYGGYAVLQEVQKVNLAPIDQSPRVVAELDPLDGAMKQPAVDTMATLPAAGETNPASDAVDRLYRPQALDAPVLVARDGPIAAIDPQTVGVLPAPVAPTGEAVAAAVATTIAPLGETPVQVVAADAPAVELLAVRPSWVRVQAADGTTIFEKILDAGERFALPKTEQAPVLRSGESGAIYFAVNGETYGPAGGRGEVTKNIVLSPEALTGKYAVADLNKDSDLARFVAVAEVAPEPAGPTALEVPQPAADQ